MSPRNFSDCFGQNVVSQGCLADDVSERNFTAYMSVEPSLEKTISKAEDKIEALRQNYDFVSHEKANLNHGTFYMNLGRSSKGAERLQKED